MSVINNQQAGDTIIEVLFAMAIFALVTVGGLSIMNKGAAAVQRSLEITQVRNEIDSQAEALRFLNASYLAAYKTGSVGSGLAKEWNDIKYSYTVAPNFIDDPVSDECKGPIFGTGRPYFIVDTKNVKVIRLIQNYNYNLPATYSQLRFDQLHEATFEAADGIWIQAVKSNEGLTSKSEYIDFHIRACWFSVGQSIPVSLETIVRLYEPR